jgi:ubiquinone/menaquinone biosynthesis C-methylase UbiE
MKAPQEKPTTFDAYASDYAELIRDPIREKFASGSRFFFERKIQVIRDFFNRAGIDTHDLSWLDAGCGQGDLMRCGLSYFKTAVGCDPSQGMLKSCEDLQVRHQAELEKLPFSDESFDFVTAVCVYHHIPYDRRHLMTAEALRVLRPKGIFCIIEHNPLNPVTRLIVARTTVDADALLLTARESQKLLSACSKVLGRRYFLLFPERFYRFGHTVENLLGNVPLGGQYAVFSQKQ